MLLILEDAIAAAGGLATNDIHPDHAFGIGPAQRGAVVRVSARWQVRIFVVSSSLHPSIRTARCHSNDEKSIVSVSVSVSVKRVHSD